MNDETPSKREASRFDTSSGGVWWSGFPQSTGLWSKTYLLDAIWWNFPHDENPVSQDLANSAREGSKIVGIVESEQLSVICLPVRR
jgi:hypothetical protein